MSTVTLIKPSGASCTSAIVVEPTPQVSIIIVNYNGGELLERCICSLRQDAIQDYEIILMDNASTDGSVEAVAQTFPDIRLIWSERNLGFGAGNNLAARQARGDYLAFLNPDTVVEPGWLDALVAALERDPRIGLATSQILLLDAPGTINTCGNDVHYTGLTLCRNAGMDRAALVEPAEVNAISGAACVIRRSLFETLRGFDDTFFLYMEDTDLSWRVRLAGYQCVCVPASVVYHDYTLHFGPHKTFYQERNRYLMLLKSLQWPTLLILSPALILAEAVTWGFVLLRERQHFANKLRAYAWIASYWNAIMHRRRETLALRRVRDRELIAGCTYRLAYEQTGDGPLARLAHAVLDPLFLILQRLALRVIRW